MKRRGKERETIMLRAWILMWGFSYLNNYVPQNAESLLGLGADLMRIDVKCLIIKQLKSADQKKKEVEIYAYVGGEAKSAMANAKDEKLYADTACHL